ncbi:flagellar filament capping protein FliD [Perlucidibaca piscinae]|uniref:flagellar filament capping protein FliD n=1 Tax=Perlucidibaca piscinae TaxID=392589 RepID=UPI0003B42E77|nr:flagellar filament capping protein FliD [Perlucidibaca piscinae]
MAGISSAGLGSGLDINSLVSQLVQAERAPASGRLTTRETRVSSKLSAYGTLKSTIAEFQESLKKLKKIETFQNRSAKVSDESLLKATGGTTATPGSYRVIVESLAQTQKLASDAYATSSTVVGTGQLQFSANGKSFNVDITAANNTLAGIRDAINGASGNPGIKASIVNATTGSHLVITAAGSGTAEGMTIAVSGATGSLGDLAYNPSAGSNPMTVKVAATDARIDLDGFKITSSTNVFSNAIDGVTLTAAKVDLATPVDITVANDSSASKTAVDQFVSSYNKLQTKLNEMTAYNATTKSAGQLQGDSLTSRLASQLRNELNTALSGVDADLDTLTELGITSAAKTGTLSVNSSKLDTLVSERFEDVAALFTGDNGLAARMNKMLDAFSGSDGSIAARTKSLQGEQKSLTTQREALDLRMTQLEARYMKQFTALDTMMSSLASTSAFLSQQLAYL